MPSEVEVISEAKSVAVAEVTFQSDVRLLRICVDEVLGLRIAEGLEAQWQKGWIALGHVQVVLI